MTTREACLSDIQRANVHHGPGIRTRVVVKGCPLHCMWCPNPQTQRFRPELSFRASMCTGCGSCAEVCPHGIHRFTEGKHTVDYKKCVACGRCVDACPSEAIRLLGQNMTVREVLSVILEERASYEQSGGGVTVSGGEPLSQADFTAELFARCREQEVHTCLETSGYGSPKSLRMVMPVTDLFLFHWTLSNRRDAMHYLGVSISPILRSLRTLMENDCKVLLRCLIVPGINDTMEHFDSIARLLDEYPSLLGAELLPYSGSGGCDETQAYPFRLPDAQESAQWQAYFTQRGYHQVRLVQP